MNFILNFITNNTANAVTMFFSFIALIISLSAYRLSKDKFSFEVNNREKDRIEKEIHIKMGIFKEIKKVKISLLNCLGISSEGLLENIYDYTGLIDKNIYYNIPADLAVSSEFWERDANSISFLPIRVFHLFGMYYEYINLVVNARGKQLSGEKILEILSNIDDFLKYGLLFCYRN